MRTKCQFKKIISTLKWCQRRKNICYCQFIIGEHANEVENDGKMTRKERGSIFFLIVIKQITMHWIFVSKKCTHLLLRTIFHPRQQIGLLQQLLLICIIFQFNLNIASTYTFDTFYGDEENCFLYTIIISTLIRI